METQLALQYEPDMIHNMSQHVVYRNTPTALTFFGVGCTAAAALAVRVGVGASTSCITAGSTAAAAVRGADSLGSETTLGLDLPF